MTDKDLLSQEQRVGAPVDMQQYYAANDNSQRYLIYRNTYILGELIKEILEIVKKLQQQQQDNKPTPAPTPGEQSKGGCSCEEIRKIIQEEIQKLPKPSPSPGPGPGPVGPQPTTQMADYPKPYHPPFLDWDSTGGKNDSLIPVKPPTTNAPVPPTTGAIVPITNNQSLPIYYGGPGFDRPWYQGGLPPAPDTAIHYQLTPVGPNNPPSSGNTTPVVPPIVPTTGAITPVTSMPMPVTSPMPQNTEAVTPIMSVPDNRMSTTREQ